MQSLFPIDPVEVTPSVASSWEDVNVSAHVPEGATGVILHLVNDYTTTLETGLRKNGSTDDRHTQGFLRSQTHTWAMIGIDSSKIFEAYLEGLTNVHLYLVGYTSEGVTFFTNGYDKTPSTLGSWQDIDCSTEAPSAIGLVFEISTTTAEPKTFGMRKKGSTDSRTNPNEGHCTFVTLIGCDASQKCQAIVSVSETVRIHLIGYVTSGAVFNTNATDLSLGSTGSWLDLSALPTNSVMAFIEVKTSSIADFGLRKNGSSEEIYEDAFYHPWAFVECDASRIIEGKIQSTNVDFFLVGYATAEVITPISLSGALTFSGSLSSVWFRAVSLVGGLTLSGTLSKLTSKNFGGLLSFVGLYSRRTYKSLAGSLTPSGILLKMARKPVSGALSFTGSLIKETGKVLDGALSLAGNLVKSTSKALGGALTPSGVLSHSRIIPQAVGGALTFAGAVATEIITFTQVAVGGVLSFAGSLTHIRTIPLNLGGGLSLTGALLKQTSKALAGGLSLSGGVLKGIFVDIGGTLTLAGSLLKMTSKNLSGLLTSYGITNKFTRKILRGTLRPTGTLKKLTRKILGGALSLIGILAAPGRDLTMKLFTRPYRNMATETRPYRDMTVETKED